MNKVDKVQAIRDFRLCNQIRRVQVVIVTGPSDIYREGSVWAEKYG